VQQTGQTGIGPRRLRLVESLPLGGRCMLHLVHVDQREILVGVDATGLKTIVPAPPAFDDVLDAAAQSETQGPTELPAPTIPFPHKAGG
jgi:flagellar biogenesis protein FliO